MTGPFSFPLPLTDRRPSVERTIDFLFDDLVHAFRMAAERPEQGPVSQWVALANAKAQTLVSALFFLTSQEHDAIRKAATDAVIQPASKPSGRRLCAHADADGKGMHFLEPGEKCPGYEVRN